MPIEQVGRLLRRWQETGGVLSRGRVIADGMRLISGLTPDERRVLARALAEEGAPELAGRLESASDGRLDAGDLHRTAEGILGLDRAQLDHLAQTLGDPDERRRLAHLAVDQLGDAAQPAGPGTAVAGTAAAGAMAAGTAAAASGRPPPPPPAGARLADAPDRPAPPAGSAPPARPSYRTESLHALANGQVPLDDIELGDQMLDHPALGDIELTETQLQQVELAEFNLHEVSLAEASAAEDATSGAAAGDAAEATTPQAPATGTAAAVAAGAAAARSGAESAAAGASEGAVQRSHAAADSASDGHRRDASADDRMVLLEHLGSVTDDTDVTNGRGGGDAVAAPSPEQVEAVLTQLRGAGSAPQRFAAVHEDRVRGLGPADALRVLDAVPEGWQRRRVALRLGEAGALVGTAAADLLRRFPRPTDATFVAGAALVDGTFDLDDLSGALPPEVHRRLTIRAGG